MGLGDATEGTRDGRSAQGLGEQGPRLVPVTGSKTLPLNPAPSVAKLMTVGVGGGGVNAVNHMIEVGVRGIEFIAMNTDAQALEISRASRKMRLGETLTRGLGAGGNPEVGRKAAEESYKAIRESLSGADIVFITAGMGGGTGTGASPLIAQAARELGALAVAIVTTPFAFERRRKLIAQDGVAALRDVVDALIVVPNERLTQLAARDISAFEAYRMADDVLRQGIQGISDLITIPGLINLDFADIRAVMADAGSALMAVGQASGEDRAEVAAKGAITNPLLDVDISGARGIVFNITAADDLTMTEVDRIAEIITSAAQSDATITFGTVYDPAMAGCVKVTVVATGFEPRVRRAAQPWLAAPAPQRGTAPTSSDPRPATTASPASARSRAPADPADPADPAAALMVQRPIIVNHDDEADGNRISAALPAVVLPPAEVPLNRPGLAEPALRPRGEAGGPPDAAFARNEPRPRRADEGVAIRRAGAESAPRRVVDERTPAQRQGARRLDDGPARAGEAGYAPRPGSLPGHYDDEYVANDDPDYDDQPSQRRGFGRIFARR